MAYMKRIPITNDPILTSAELIQKELEAKADEYTRLSMSQDPVENRMAEALRPEMDRLSRLLAQASPNQATTGGGYPLPSSVPQTGGGYPLPPSVPQTGGGYPLPPSTSPVRKIPRYIVRMSPAWARAQTAAGKKPEDEIKKLIPPGANFTIQNI